MTNSVSGAIPAVSTGSMLVIKDENGGVIRSFPALTWTPDGGFPRPEIKSDEIIFTADEEGVASDITFIDLNDKKQASRLEKFAKYPNADISTVFSSAKAQKVGVIIRCVDDGVARRVWSSDLHQVSRCDKCQNIFRRDRAKAKRETEKAAKAATV